MGQGLEYLQMGERSVNPFLFAIDFHLVHRVSGDIDGSVFAAAAAQGTVNSLQVGLEGTDDAGHDHGRHLPFDSHYILLHPGQRLGNSRDAIGPPFRAAFGGGSFLARLGSLF